MTHTSNMGLIVGGKKTNSGDHLEFSGWYLLKCELPV